MTSASHPLAGGEKAELSLGTLGYSRLPVPPYVRRDPVNAPCTVQVFA